MTYEDLLAAVRNVTPHTPDEEIIRVLAAAEESTPRQYVELVQALEPRWGWRSPQGPIGDWIRRLTLVMIRRRLHRADRWLDDMSSRINDTGAETLWEDLAGWVAQILRADDPDPDYGPLLTDDLRRQRLLALLARRANLPLDAVMDEAGRQLDLWGRLRPDVDAAMNYLQDQLARQGQGQQVLAPWQIMELTRGEDDDPDALDELQRRKRRRISAYVSMLQAGVPHSTIAGAALIATRNLLVVDAELGQARWVASRPPQSREGEGGATA